MLKSGPDLAFDLETASLCYLHVPQFLGNFLSCVDDFKHEFAEQLTADAKKMYQAVMDGLYQKVAEFATTKTDQKQNFSLNLNFKSPYVALPKSEILNSILMFSFEFLVRR